MKIVVLGGGISTERHVAMVTGTSVCKGLRQCGHRAIFVDMFLGLEIPEAGVESLFDAPDGLIPPAAIETEEPDLEKVKKNRGYDSKSRLGRNVLEVCAAADCVFLGLHGADGEDGKIQATLDLMGVPYTGSDYLGSGLAMEKSKAKMIMDYGGIRTPAWKFYDYKAEDIENIKSETKLPCVVKIVDGGSSLGVYIADTEEELDKALRDMLKYGSKVIIEDKISGRELTLPMLGEGTLEAIEIVPPEGGSFDYVAKYQSGSIGANELCPADIPRSVYNEMSQMALKLNKLLGVEVYSRTDFILDENNVPWCLEVNTLPGMTPNSLINKAAKVAGLEYKDLCDKIVMLSLEKKKNR